MYFNNDDIDECVLFRVDGEGAFSLGNETSNSFCKDMSRVFEGLEDTTLTGKHGFCFIPNLNARLVAVLLE